MNREIKMNKTEFKNAIALLKREKKIATSPDYLEYLDKNVQRIRVVSEDKDKE